MFEYLDSSPFVGAVGILAAQDLLLRHGPLIWKRKQRGISPARPASKQPANASDQWPECHHKVMLWPSTGRSSRTQWRRTTGRAEGKPRTRKPFRPPAEREACRGQAGTYGEAGRRVDRLLAQNSRPLQKASAQFRGWLSILLPLQDST